MQIELLPENQPWPQVKCYFCVQEVAWFKSFFGPVIKRVLVCEQHRDCTYEDVTEENRYCNKVKISSVQ